MIEVNLLPGGKKRPTRRGARFALPVPVPKLGALSQDRWVLGSAAVVTVLVLAAAYLFWSLSGSYGDTQSAIEEASADSARYADLIQQAHQLRARRDSIAQRVKIIQNIDEDRYIWPHIMDEVARALPDYTWLTGTSQTNADPLQFRITGMAGNNFALTTFMENLEASPFIRDVTLVNTQATVQTSGGVSERVNQFTLDASFERPPMDALKTVPLLAEGDSGAAGAPSGASGGTNAAVSDSAGAAAAGRDTTGASTVTPAGPGDAAAAKPASGNRG